MLNQVQHDRREFATHCSPLLLGEGLGGEVLNWTNWNHPG